MTRVTIGAAVALAWAALGVLPGCGAPGGRGTPAGDARPADAVDAGDPTVGDAANAEGDALAGDPNEGPRGDESPPPDNYRSSLGACWTDAQCPRVMAIGHGGMWDVSSVPYESNAALVAAYEGGMDGVKIDVRVTADDVPVIAHSSPIESFESLDCYNKRIENMTAAQVTKCHRVPSLTETFQRLDDVLEYLRGKMVVQLCVKEPTDYARTIQEVLALGAQDFAFLEISPGELKDLIPTLPDGNSVYYLINFASDLSLLDTLLDEVQNPRAFMYEFDPPVDLGDLITTRLHPAGVRAFTYEDSRLATQSTYAGHYGRGYDVVSADHGPEVVRARVEANTGRGVDPP